MAEIIGGIDALGSNQIDTIVSGGNPVVVGHNALDAMRDRAIYLKDDLDSLGTKKLLGIIGMSQPISFGAIEYDDGETSFIISSKKSRTTPESELIGELSARLNSEPAKIADWLIKYLNLEQPIWLAMGDFLDNIIRQIDNCLTSRGKKPLNTLMIGTQLGCLIPFTTCGKLEVSPNPDVDAKTFKAFASYLLDICVAKKCIEPIDKESKENISISDYPKLDESVIAEMLQDIKNQVGDDIEVVDLVRAIIVRENRLTPYLVAVEKYNVSVAHGIQEYTSRILEYFAKTG